MTSGGPGVSLSYDPLMRLHQVAGTATTQFGWDGADLIAEYDGAGALQRRYVMDPGDPAGQPVVWYEGSGTSDRRFLSADERGSIISVTDGSGALLGINRYDEFGQPQSTNIGRFGYTGQAWLPELGVWYYRARMYEPELGRFLQLDPIGYADSPNLYQYVLNDPVNLSDPLGLCIGGGGSAGGSWTNGYSITCPRLDDPFEFDWIRGLFEGGRGQGDGGGIVGGIGGGLPGTTPPPIVPPPPPTPKPPKPNQPKVPCHPTGGQLENSGKVMFRFSEASSSVAGTGAVLHGNFVTEGGYSGTFTTTAYGYSLGGKGPGGAWGAGTSESLKTFQGTNLNIVATLAFVTISDNFDTSFRHIGDTDSISTPGLSIDGSTSYTRLDTVMCPK